MKFAKQLFLATICAVGFTAQAKANCTASSQPYPTISSVNTRMVNFGVLNIRVSVPTPSIRNSSGSDSSCSSYSYSTRIYLDGRYVSGSDFYQLNTNFIGEGFHHLVVDVSDNYNQYARSDLRFEVRNNWVNPAVFDLGYYMNRHPDVTAAAWGDAGRVLQHWLIYGVHEGRQASPSFHALEYMQLNQDVLAAVGGSPTGAIDHYLALGVHEGRLATYAADGAGSMFAPFNLSAGQSFRIKDMVLAMQGDGNLVLYRGGQAIWATNSSGRDCGSCFAAFQGDGNLVLYGPGGAFWASNTSTHEPRVLLISTEAPHLRIIRGRVTASGPVGPLPGQAYGPFSIRAGQSISWGGVSLVMQGDGNLVAYAGGGAVWASNTSGRDCGSCFAAFQGDGNLVLYGPGGPFWASNTSDNPGARLYLLQSAPHLQIQAASGVVVFK